MSALWHTAQALAATRWRSRPGLSRARFERWQAGALARWLARDLPGVARYRDMAGAALSDLPVVDKARVMADFAAFNRGGITADQGWRALAAGGRIDAVSIGASTGTSGNRSLYAITLPERGRWLGTIAAHALPEFPWRAERVAVILPQSSALYDTAARSWRMALRFYSLTEGMEHWLHDLSAFAPTTIVAPPRILRALAEEAPASLAPRRLFAGAETLDPVDRAVIERRFERRLGQIYMASEGLFGVSCAHGTLHLAEDSTFFEFEAAGGGLVNPVITSFRRSYQIMARYRMNDLIRLSDTPCPCGSPLRAVAEVAGRMDDVFALPQAGREVLITPDVMRNAVLDASRAITDFRIHQTGPAEVTLILPPDLGGDCAAAALAALRALIAARVPGATVLLRRAPLPLRLDRKLRRVERLWPARPDTGSTGTAGSTGTSCTRGGAT